MKYMLIAVGGVAAACAVAIILQTKKKTAYIPGSLVMVLLVCLYAALLPRLLSAYTGEKPVTVIAASALALIAAGVFIHYGFHWLTNYIKGHRTPRSTVSNGEVGIVKPVIRQKRKSVAKHRRIAPPKQRVQIETEEPPVVKPVAVESAVEPETQPEAPAPPRMTAVAPIADEPDDIDIESDYRGELARDKGRQITLDITPEIDISGLAPGGEEPHTSYASVAVVRVGDRGKRKYPYEKKRREDSEFFERAREKRPQEVFVPEEPEVKAEAEEERPEGPQAPSLRGVKLKPTLRSAFEKKAAGNYEGAAQEFSACLENEKGRDRALYVMEIADCLLRAGKTEEASDFAKRAMEEETELSEAERARLKRAVKKSR